MYGSGLHSRAAHCEAQTRQVAEAIRPAPWCVFCKHRNAVEKRQEFQEKEQVSRFLRIGNGEKIGV